MQARNRTRVELRSVGRATGNVSTNKIGVAALEVGGKHDMALVDAIAKSRSESFDLLLDALAHVERGPIRNVAVCPERLLSARRARRVESARLHHEHVRLFRRAALPSLALALC